MGTFTIPIEIADQERRRWIESDALSLSKGDPSNDKVALLLSDTPMLSLPPSRRCQWELSPVPIELSPIQASADAGLNPML